MRRTAPMLLSALTWEKAKRDMRKKPILLVMSPLEITAREEKWLKDHGCTLAFQNNRCTITCPAGTTRIPMTSVQIDQHVRRYAIMFPNGTRIIQYCVQKWWFFGLPFGGYRTIDLLIENTKV